MNIRELLSDGVDCSPNSAQPRSQILIAGIGNIFMGDDGFGCEVVNALSKVQLPDEVKVQDFAIRSYDLAYALTDGYEAVILVDAVSQGSPPGTVFLIEPEVGGHAQAASSVDAHAMNPVAVIQMAQSLGGIKAKLYLVGCEPRVLENDDGQIGLSDEVRGVVPRAVEMIEQLMNELLEKQATHAGPGAGLKGNQHEDGRKDLDGLWSSAGRMGGSDRGSRTAIDEA